MFISVSFEKDTKLDNNKIEKSYIVEDTTASIRMHVPLEIDIVRDFEDHGASFIPSGLITTYAQLNQNISKNLALFYRYDANNYPENIKKYIDKDVEFTDKYFPFLNYSTNYYKCLLYQVRTLTWVGLMR